uniref:3'(2'),5'-bisphosphate nucleotidase 1 n=1 Tax=Caenorhabditis japonica TaxID=281687 RepID=A0A8R1DN03_CAEJA
MAGGDLKIIDKAEQGSGYDPQTEADRRAQFCIVQSLQQRFKNINIIGEEDDTTACPELESGFSEDVLLTDRLLSNELREIKESEVVVWVDPLDGTSEVALAVKNKNLALLEQVTVLIGVAYKGRPVAGIIHQPYHADNGRTVWAIRGCGVHGLAPATENTKKIVVTTRSHLSESVSSALDALKHQNLADSVEKVGGAGFKVLKVLEGCAAYVFASAGCKKWDTCAVEAVLSAAGGRLTDISGRDIRYEPDVQVNNTGGVLATASWVAHQEYINTIPQEIKNNLPEIVSKK